jgi:hypothetical protein
MIFRIIKDKCIAMALHLSITFSTPWLQAYTKASANVSLPSASVLLTFSRD